MQYRHQRAELHRSANRHYDGQRRAAASIHAQPKQHAIPAVRSTHNHAKQDRQWVPELPQQQPHAGLPVIAAVKAEPSSGNSGHADAAHLEAELQSQSCNQPNAKPAFTDTLEQPVSAQLPLQGRAGKGLHAGHMGHDMCEPVELTWEGVLQAASGIGQAPCDTGEALQACSSTMAPMR